MGRELKIRKKIEEPRFRDYNEIENSHSGCVWQWMFELLSVQEK